MHTKLLIKITGSIQQKKFICTIKTNRNFERRHPINHTYVDRFSTIFDTPLPPPPLWTDMVFCLPPKNHVDFRRTTPPLAIAIHIFVHYTKIRKAHLHRQFFFLKYSQPFLNSHAKNWSPKNIFGLGMPPNWKFV